MRRLSVLVTRGVIHLVAHSDAIVGRPEALARNEPTAAISGVQLAMLPYNYTPANRNLCHAGHLHALNCNYALLDIYMSLKTHFKESKKTR